MQIQKWQDWLQLAAKKCGEQNPVKNFPYCIKVAAKLKNKK
jgi:hypothetical protein